MPPNTYNGKYTHSYNLVLADMSSEGADINLSFPLLSLTVDFFTAKLLSMTLNDNLDGYG